MHPSPRIGRAPFPLRLRAAVPRALPLLFLLAASILPGQPAPPGYPQIPAAVGVCSTFSTGALSLDELAGLAARGGLQALVLGDHLRRGHEYGFPPLLPLIRLRREYPSVSTHGIGRYLAEIRRINREQERVLFIPGVEIEPHYYWSGSLLRGGLGLHNDRMGLRVIGLPEEGDYRALPMLDGPPSLRYFLPLLPAALASAAALLAGLWAMRSGRRLLLVGAALLAIGLSGLIGHHPFRSSRFDAYHGDPGAGPYQELIDSARERRGVVAWSAPEAWTWEWKAGAVRLRSTPAHPEALLQTRGYTAFDAIYGEEWGGAGAGPAGFSAARSAVDHGGPRRAHLPGEAWDQALLEYCRGARLQPVWCLGSFRFSRPGEGRRLQLDAIQTIFLARERTAAGLLDALGRGRMYAVYQGGPSPIRLEEFLLTTADGRTAVQGEELGAADRVRVSFRIRLEDGAAAGGIAASGGGERLRVQLIRCGKVLADFQAETPAAGELADEFPPDSGKFYYRLRAWSDRYEILSNPIFVSY